MSMLNGKQRAKLRALANGIDTIVHIGKGGINGNIAAQADDALKAREIVKCRVLDAALLSAAEACEALCGMLNAEPVQVIGTRFVIYRENPEDRKIFLDRL
jgi:RNA-binding protein